MKSKDDGSSAFRMKRNPSARSREQSNVDSIALFRRMFKLTSTLACSAIAVMSSLACSGGGDGGGGTPTSPPLPASYAVTFRWRDDGCERRSWDYVDVTMREGSCSSSGWSIGSVRLMNDRNASGTIYSVPAGTQCFTAITGPAYSLFLQDNVSISDHRTITLYCNQ